MSVIGGILLFGAGLVVGGGAVVYNHRSILRETDKLRRENGNLKNSAWEDRLQYETDRAYRKGYKDGRMSPANDAERFAHMIEERNIDFRAQGGKKRG